MGGMCVVCLLVAAMMGDGCGSETLSDSDRQLQGKEIEGGLSDSMGGWE